MAIDQDHLLLLLNWMSPTFPVGSFAYSHGLEQAIADGRIRDPGAVESWVADLLLRGSGWNDAVLFALAWDGDDDELGDLALALAGSHERYLETTQLGRAFLSAAAVWTSTGFHDGAVAYPVAAGRTCKAFGIPREQALLAYLHAFCSALVSVAVRLVPIGQTQGLVVMRNLAGTVQRVSKEAGLATREDLGSCCLAADIAAMAHETLEPRLFRT